MLGVTWQRQPRLSGREARARTGLTRAAPRNRRPLWIAATHVHDGLRRDLRVVATEFLPLVDERRPAQRADEKRRELGAAWAAPRVVVVGAKPGRPRRPPAEILELLHRRPDRLCVPRQVHEHEVVREIELIAAADVAHESLELEEVHLPHE